MAEAEAPAREARLGPLAGSLGFLLRIAQLQAYERFFAALGPGAVQPGEFTVLLAIGMNPGVRQGVLAERLMIKRAHMAKIVQGFVAEGLVARRVPPEDRRAVELRLTDAGAARVAARRAAFLGWDAGPAPGLTEDETDRLRALLAKLTGIFPGDPERHAAQEPRP